MPFFPPFLFPPSSLTSSVLPFLTLWSLIFNFLFPSLPPSDLPFPPTDSLSVWHKVCLGAVGWSKYHHRVGWKTALQPQQLAAQQTGKILQWPLYQSVCCVWSGAYECRKGTLNYCTLVDPILCRIWCNRNVPYIVAVCLHQQMVLVRATGLLRIHMYSSNLKTSPIRHVLKWDLI